MESIDKIADISTSIWYEVDGLIAMLRAWGIHYLVGMERTADSPAITQDQQTAVAFLQHLAQCHDYPQVRDAIISLLLLHPELASAVQQAVRESEPGVAAQIATLALATLYLQQLWFIRLTIALGHPPGFPEQPFADLWESRHLPPPNCQEGRCGLIALQEYEQQRTGLPFTFTGDWQNQLDHLLRQEEARHHPFPHHQLLPMLELLMETTQDRQELTMSMRPGVDKTAIESFLRQVGKSFHKPARLYLVGGAALVHAGVRAGTTQDIDIQVGALNEGDLIVAIQRLIDSLQVNVEFASPIDFIPLPAQWESHTRFVGRYGKIDVFYFDFYSIALSKIERGNNRDIADVKLLIEQGIITLDTLDQSYQEVLAQLGKGRYPRVTPQRFKGRYQAIRQLL